MSGHGHVYPNEDGSVARCGGPGICMECSLEANQKKLEDLGAVPAPPSPPIEQGEEKISAEEAAYRAKVLSPCEPPCDSYGVCDSCCERHLYLAGYARGLKAERERGAAEIAELKRHAAEVETRSNIEHEAAHENKDQRYRADRLARELKAARAHSQHLTDLLSTMALENGKMREALEIVTSELASLVEGERKIVSGHTRVQRAVFMLRAALSSLRASGAGREENG